jgi:hypothetical protein
MMPFLAFAVSGNNDSPANSLVFLKVRKGETAVPNY